MNRLQKLSLKTLSKCLAPARLAALALLCAAALGSSSVAAEPEEFDAAAKAFNDGFYDRAAGELGAFLEKYPASERRAQVTMLLAQAFAKTGKQDDVIKVLTPFAPPANLADERLFWLGEAHLGKGANQEAANLFDQLARERPESPRLAQALYGRALAELRLGAVTNTVSLLQGPESAFHKAVTASKETNLWFRGQLLLSQALVKATNQAAAIALLNNLTNAVSDPALLWQRSHSLAELQLQARQLPAALAAATNLVALSARTPELAQRKLDAFHLEAEIYQQLNRPGDAAAVHARVAADQGFPPENRRRAILEVTRILMAAQQFTNAAAQLSAFIQANPADSGLDQLRITLADVYLQQFIHLRKQPSPPPCGQHEHSRAGS